MRNLIIAALLALPLGALAQPTPVLNLKGTAPIVVAPSGATTAPRVISCPTCGTGTGTVTSVATGTGLTGGPVTTTGTISFASLTANQILGSLTAVAPSGLSMPSCSASTGALKWTSGVGFGCNTVGLGSVTSVASGTGLTGGPVTGTGTLSLASLSANQLLGSLTAVAPSGLSVPSCSAASSALTWTTATGFGCNTISSTATFPLTAAGATQTVGQMTVTGTNAGMAVIPNGTGAFMLALPDGTTTGGNARGANAADLQTVRAINSYVASGAGSFAAGRSNTASGIDSVVAGTTNVVSQTASVALGDTNNVSATHSVALGWAHTVSGQQSIAGGRGHTVVGQSSGAFGEFGSISGGASFGFGSRFTDRSNAGVFVYGETEAGGTGGDWEYHLFYQSGNTASAFRLTQGGNAAIASTCASIAAGSGALFRVDLIAVDTTAFHTWVFTMGPALITRSGAAATTAMGTGNPVFVAGPTDATAPAIATVPTATADTTNGCLNVSFTPPAGNTDTIKVSARISYVYRF